MPLKLINHLPRSRPIKKYGEEAYRELHCFKKHKAENNVKKERNIIDLSSLVSDIFIKFTTYHYDFVNLPNLCKVHVLLLVP